MINIEKDNVSKIAQNFGERLTMFHLYHYLGWDVEYVDYVGADIMAIDRETKRRYAISVKTRKMNEKWEGDKVFPESRSFTLFRNKDAQYLREFANDMDMEPLVAFVVVFQRKNKTRGNNSAYLFLIGLDDLEDMRDKTSYVWTHEEKEDKSGNVDVGFSLRFGDRDEATLHALCEDERVTWFQMEINDHQIANSYNLNPKITQQQLSSEHWSKQQGTFGEYLALWHLGKNHKIRGYHVDSVGADLVLIDSDNPSDENEQYAVSVKTFTYDAKQPSYQFEKANETKLLQYAKKWGRIGSMLPMICFNCIRYGESPIGEKRIEKIYMMAFLISHVDELMKQGCKSYIYRTDKSDIITIKYDDEALEKIKKDPEIVFSEIDFTHHHYFLGD